MKSNLLKKLIHSPMVICLLSIQVLTYSTAFAKSSGGGVIGGGGGDASEARVDEIRSDILKWINDKGSLGLNLPDGVSQGEYADKMIQVLQPKEVIIGFVESDDKYNDELKVSVDGTPKTCRGFLSNIDSKPHILCNINRFKNTSESEQYKLIHHEYAGLVSLENNEGAASDYSISSQITDFLSRVEVLKLAVKKPVTQQAPKEAVYKSCLIHEQTQNVYRPTLGIFYGNHDSFQFYIEGINYYKNANGQLTEQPKTLFATDASENERSVKLEAEKVLITLQKQGICPK